MGRDAGHHLLASASPAPTPPWWAWTAPRSAPSFASSSAAPATPPPAPPLITSPPIRRGCRPRWIAIVAAIVAVLLVGGYLIWRQPRRRRRLRRDRHRREQRSARGRPGGAQGPPAAPAPPRRCRVPTGGPVVLTASEDVWLRISDGASPRPCSRASSRPASATRCRRRQAPTLRTGRANVLSVTVGGTPVPPLGPPEKTIANVSLRASDLIARAERPAPGPSGPARARRGPVEIRFSLSALPV
jgi:cytoskeleton protein RodZ